MKNKGILVAALIAIAIVAYLVFSNKKSGATTLTGVGTLSAAQTGALNSMLNATTPAPGALLPNVADLAAPIALNDLQTFSPGLDLLSYPDAVAE